MIQNDLDLWEPAQRLGGFVKANAWSGHFPSQNICCLGCYEAREMSGERNKGWDALWMPHPKAEQIAGRREAKMEQKMNGTALSEQTWGWQRLSDVYNTALGVKLRRRGWTEQRNGRGEAYAVQEIICVSE